MENQRHIQKSHGCKTKKCDKHGDYTPNIISFNGREIKSACPECLRQQEVDRELLNKSSATDSIKLLNSIGISKRFHNSSFDNYKPVNSLASENLKSIISYYNNFENIIENGNSLILCGSPGTGKTHLASALASKIALSRKHRVVYTTAYKMFRSIKSTYSQYSEQTEDEIIGKLTRSSLLIIDEVGIQFGSEAEKVLFYQVINGRYDNVLPTVLVSNMTKNELSDSIGERCFDRLKEESGVILSFSWNSYRK